MEGRDIIQGPHAPQPREEPPPRSMVPPEQPGENIAQVFALVVGLAYTLIGIVGFAVTGFTGLTTNGGDDLVGFDLNVFHNVVHLGIGLGFLAVSRLADPRITQGVIIAGGLVYILAAGLGFLNELQILSIDDEFAADNFLHLFSGLAAVIFGLIGARRSDERTAQLARA